MSNEMEEQTMKPEEKRVLVPKLRFPEFREEGEWCNKPMDELYSFKGTNSLSRDKLNYERGSVKNIHYGDIHTKFAPLFDIRNERVPFINPSEPIEKINSNNYCVESDMIFADASEDLDDIGKSIELVQLNDERLLSGLHTILARQKDDNLVVGFGGHLFQAARMRTQIKKEAQGAKVLGISPSRLSRIEVCYPSDKKEQQEIADCLSSIDDLITAQNQKLDTLKAHKKGVMQRLFPAKGESLPKLRFPEFWDVGEWNTDAFDELMEVIDGDRGINYPKAEEFSRSGYCLFLNAKNVTKTGFKFEEMQFVSKEKDEALRKGKLQRADVVLTTRGTVGQFAYFSEEVPYDNIRINSGMVILRIKTKKINSDYLYAFSKSGLLGFYIKNIAFGNAQQQLTVAEIKKFQLYYPGLDEQQEIADCLSSVDELVTLETQKLDALKAYKKGLMQQLFPALDQVRE